MSLETEVEEYFSSLSCLSKTFIALEKELQESYGEQWDALTEEERESIFNDLVIPQSIADLYPGADSKKLPAVFPKLKVACGEKIIVEESGRTWVDEHSGPFSWANRSQQDLTLFGTDDEMQEKKPVRPPRRQRSPDKGISLGKTLGNPQPEMSAQDEIFQKFGIQFGTDQDEDDEEEPEDSSGPLLPNPDPKKESSYTNTEMLPESEIDYITSQMDHVTLSSQSDATDSLGTTYQLPELNTKLDLELSTGSELSYVPKSPKYNTVPLNPPEDEEGANFDTDFTLASTDIKFELENQVIDVQPISIPYPEFLEADEKEKDGIKTEAKTGFDFLDNW